MIDELVIAIRKEAAAAPAPAFDLEEIRRRGARRRRRSRIARTAMATLVLAGVALATILANDRSPLRQVTDQDPAPVVVPGMGTRLLDLPFESGSIVTTTDGTVYVTAGSSSDMTEPGQLYRSVDGGEAWAPVLEEPRGNRLGPIAASGEVVVAVGWYQLPPSESSAGIDILDPSPYRWYLRVDPSGATELIGEEAPPLDDVAATESGFVGIAQQYPECRVLLSRNGITWSSEGAPACPRRLGSVSGVNGRVVADAGDGEIWLLTGSEFGPVDLPLEEHSEIPSPRQLSFSRPAVDGRGRLVAYARITEMVGDTARVDYQDVLIAYSDDGSTWELAHRRVQGEAYPYGVTGLDAGFVGVVSGEVLTSEDGIDWTPPGDDLGADYWSWESGVIVDRKLLVPVGPPAGVDLPRRLAVVELD